MSYWYNWFSWWWARGCSKHVEIWDKYIEKNCASSWSFTMNHNRMQGQQNIKSILRSIAFFFRKSYVCEIMWKNIVEPDGPQMTIRRMRIACWVTKATDTHSEYVTLIVFPRQQWLRELVSVMFIARTLPVSSRLSVVSVANIRVMQIYGGRRNSIFSRIRLGGRTTQV